MSLATAPSIVIKVPVHAGKPRAAPPVAARLKARSFPARHGASPEVRPETLTESWHPRGVMPSIVPLLPSLSTSALVASRATTPLTRVSLPPENARAHVAPARPRSRFVDKPPASTRRLPCPQAVARKELIVASRKARVSANAAAHNARVSDVHDVAALVESQVTQYRRSSIDRRLEVRTHDTCPFSSR